MCFEFGLCKFIGAGDKKSEPRRYQTEILKIWRHILFIEHQQRKIAKVEPANTIIWDIEKCLICKTSFGIEKQAGKQYGLKVSTGVVIPWTHL